MKPFLLRLSVPLSLVLALALAWFQGYRLNVTPSLPQGIYQITGKPVERGDLVFFCLEQNNPFSELARERGYLGPGQCPSGLRPLVKEVAGLPQDHINIQSGQLFLNGKALPGVKIAATDSQKRPLPPSLLKPEVIPAGQVLLLSDQHTGSFDSRYFGLVPLSSATALEAIFTF